VRDVDVEFTADPVYRIRIVVTNTTGGVTGSSALVYPRLKVDNTQVLKGSYDRMTSLESHLKSTETSLMDVSFPFRVKLNIAREEVEIEFYEAGSYTVTIAIHQ